jgi:ubiquinone/menaquinone biosynthesis C-methylase UbiE
MTFGRGSSVPGARGSSSRGGPVTGPAWHWYDSVAGAYDHAWHPSFEPVARDLVDLVGVARHEAVLDVGTGTGVVAAAAAERADQGVVVGIDPSVAMLRLASTHTPLAPVAGQSPGLPFPARTFDVVVANLVITHFERYDTALADMVRILRAGGRLGVTAWGLLDDDEPVDDRQQRELTEIWRSTAARFVDIEAAADEVEAGIPWEAWFGDPAHLQSALEGGGLREVALHSRTYRRRFSRHDALAGFETSFRGRYLRQRLGDADWERFRREVAAAAAALPDPITRVDQLLIGVGTKRYETRP